MKSHLLITALVMALAVSLAACSTKTLVQDRLIEPYPEEFLFLPTGSNQNLVITFNDKWRLIAPDWVHCSKYNGSEGTSLIQFSTDVNRTGRDQSGVLRFECNDGTIVSFPVIQPHPYLRVSFKDDSISSLQESDPNNTSLVFNWNDSRTQGGRFVSVLVESNVDWRFDFKDLTTLENEFELSQSRGFGSAELTLVPRRNNVDKQTYECLLTADAYMPGESGRAIGEGVDSYSFPLCQKNLRFLLNDDTEDIDCNVDELGQGTIVIEIDSELPWSVSGQTEWVAMSTTSGDAGLSQIVLRASGINPSREERSMDIVLHSSGGADRVIHFRQTPFTFSVDNSKVRFDNEGNITAVLNLSSSGPWSVTGPDWLDISASGQDGNGSVTLSCFKQNLELEDLSGIVRFTSHLNSLIEDSAVSQDAFVFDIVPDETIKKIPAMSTNTYPAIIYCSGEWSLSSSQSWVNLSSLSGAKDATIYMGASTFNPNLEKDRDATITIVSETHKACGITLKKEIPLKQTRFLFDITPVSTSLPAYSASSTFSLDIVCSQNWEIVDCPNWLVPEAMSGSFDKKLSFTVYPNTDKSRTRSGRIRVHSIYNNAYLETDLITQDKFIFNIRSNSSFTNLPPVDVGQISVSVNCTEEAPWEVISNDEWLSLKTVSGSGSSDVIVAPKDNPKTASRSSSLRIRNKVSMEELNVSFAQNAFVFSVSGNTFSFDELDTSQKTITIDCSSDWTIEKSNLSWVNLSVTSGNGKKEVTLRVDNNVETKSRSGTITVYSNLQRGTTDELKKSIGISQSAYKFDTTQENISGVGAINENGRSQTVNITCSGGWRVEHSTDWLQFDPSTGRGNGSLKITPATNASLYNRTAAFKIVSTDNLSLSKTVVVQQDPYIFTVDTNQMEFSATASNKSCNIRSSAKWTVSTDSSWISVSTTEGDKDRSLNIYVERNTSRADRKGKVTIKSQYGNHVLTINVTQKKP